MRKYFGRSYANLFFPLSIVRLADSEGFKRVTQRLELISQDRGSEMARHATYNRYIDTSLLPHYFRKQNPLKSVWTTQIVWLFANAMLIEWLGGWDRHIASLNMTLISNY